MDAIRMAGELLALGQASADLDAGEMVARAVVVYGAALVIVRLGHRRFMGRSTAFDVLLAIVLGSMLSRAIVAASPLVPTVVATAALVALHWLLAALAFRFRPMATLVKGRPRVLIIDGQVQWDAMRRSHIGEHDLLEALHIQGQVQRPEDVAVARLERSGEISVIPRAAVRAA